ncbi:MAG: nucleotidyltransferase family protein [Candidatus Brocadiales bacterium]|nr:nucleotidyltransferase family protein [Candidatus Brocadiales bacterium]
MGKVQIEVPQDLISEFCKRNNVRKLALFGSVLRGDFRENSDVDVLIEFEPGHGTGYFGLARMERELSSILGRKVDLRTPQELSRDFRDEVLSHAEIQHAEG